MGFLVDDDTPVVWRGPMIMKTIQQFAQNVDRGELEILVVDLPPGTGDAQLSLVQTIPLGRSAHCHHTATSSLQCRTPGSPHV